MQRAAICNNTHELQPSVSFVKRCGLQPERSGGKIRLQKESAYWPLEWQSSTLPSEPSELWDPVKYFDTVIIQHYVVV